MIDEVFSSIAKADGVSGGMDNGGSVGVNEQPPNQPKDDLQHVLEEESESPRTRASNLFGGKRQTVKRRKLASNMTVFLNRFYKCTCRIEELKLETAIKLHEDNKKLEI